MAAVWVWFGAHRTGIVLCIAVAMWILAYWWYFKVDIDKYLRRRQPKDWYVDTAERAKFGKVSRTR